VEGPTIAGAAEKLVDVVAIRAATTLAVGFRGTGLVLRDAAAGANRSAADHAAWPVPWGFAAFVDSTALLTATGSGCSTGSGWG
jgi:hypothetical protein